MRKTPNLNMTVYEPVIDDEQQFDLNVAINQNLDILDGAVAAREPLLKNTETSTTIGDTDTLPYVEAATARKTKRITFAKVKDTLNTYFGTLFAAKTHAATHSAGGTDPISLSAADIGADSAGSAAAVQTNLTAHAGNTTSHITAAERNNWSGKANPAQSFTATIPTSGWSSSAPYSITISVSGITASDTPIIDVVQSNTTETAKQQLKSWGSISRIKTNANSITVYAYEQLPTVAIPIQLKVVR